MTAFSSKALRTQASATAPDPARARADDLALLRWYVDTGVTFLVDEHPHNRTRRSPPASSSPTTPAVAPAASAVTPEPPPARAPPSSTSLFAEPLPLSPDAGPIALAGALAAGADTLPALRAALDSFDACDLRHTARNLVFADGNPRARVMLIGEAPGRDEDIQGLPFVGRSGKLLDRMLAVIGLDRSRVYITNILPWRPPGNRAPTEFEKALCRPFLRRHIVLFDPAVIVLLGGVAAADVLETTVGITKLRGTWREHRVDGRVYPTLAMFHPAFLLRQPGRKRSAWADLLTLRDRLVGLGIETGKPRYLP